MKSALLLLQWYNQFYIVYHQLFFFAQLMVHKLYKNQRILAELSSVQRCLSFVFQPVS